MPPRARRGAQAPVPARQLSGTAARVHALVIQLAKQGEADGHSLLSVSKSAASELERLLADDEFSATGGHLDALGTLEFWASVCAVHVYALHDYCALYQEMQQLLDRQAHQRTEAAQQDHTEEDEEEETPQVQRLARLLERTSVLMFGICGIVASSDALSHNSPGHERRVLALLRSDTFKSYSAVFDAVTRGRRLPRSQADTTVLACGSLMVLMSSCTGIHNVPCHSNADCNLQLYSEFIKAAADSHVIDHACRAAMRFHVSATREQQGCDAIGVTTLKPADRARRLAVVAGLRQPLDYMRRNLNMMIYKLAASLVAPPQPGTDPALLALLPAVRGLLSGTGVQLWVAKQLLDVANVVPVAETAAAGQEPKGYTGVAAAAGAVTADASRYLGLPPTARTPPHLLSYVMLGSSIHDEEAGLPDAKGAAIALRMALDIARTVWQITISGPLAPVMVVPGVPIGGSAGSRGSATAACSAAGGSVAGGSAAGGSSAGGSAAGGSAAGVGSAKGASAAASPGAGGGAARVSVARSSSAGGSRAGGGLVAGARAAVGTSAVGAPGPLVHYLGPCAAVPHRLVTSA